MVNLSVNKVGAMIGRKKELAILEMEKKCEALTEVYPEFSIHKVLITIGLPLKKLVLEEYFDQNLTMKDLFSHCH